MRARSFILLVLAVTMAPGAEKPVRRTIPAYTLSLVTRDQEGRIPPPTLSGFSGRHDPHSLPSSVIEVVLPVPMKRIVAERALLCNTAPRENTTSTASVSRFDGIAPFDTVYEQGFYGQRRYLFDRNEVRNILRRSNQRHTPDGWEETSRVECTYSTTGLTVSRIEYDPAFVGGISWRDCFVYDGAGHITSSRRESIDERTGSLLSAVYDSSAFDDHGERVFSQTEWWYNGTDPAGGKYTYEKTGSTSVSTSYDRSPWGWSPVSKSTWMDSPSDEAYENLTQEWKNGRWENSILFRYNYYVRDGEESSSSRVWVDERWSPDTRSVYLSPVSVTDLQGWEAYTWMFLTERWTGRKWLPASRQVNKDAGDGITYEYRFEVWDDGWVPEYVCASGWGEDGYIRSIDSSWHDRSLHQCLVESRQYLGGLVSSRFEWWDGPGRLAGGATERTYSPWGCEAQSTEFEWHHSCWEPVGRYVMTYDTGNLVRSVVHYIHTPGGWIPSPTYSASDSAGTPGTYWCCQIQGMNYEEQAFEGFVELHFVYRNHATDVTGHTGAVPGETALLQNYPNPFNPTTTIPFAVATGARTTIGIYDALGREVARPVDEWKDPGEYKVQFDASGLASGMYLCRFTSGSVTHVRKLTLVR